MAMLSEIFLYREMHETKSLPLFISNDESRTAFDDMLCQRQVIVV